MRTPFLSDHLLLVQKCLHLEVSQSLFGEPMVKAAPCPSLQQAEVDPEVKVVVLEGEGEKAFCAGGDVRSKSSS